MNKLVIILAAAAVAGFGTSYGQNLFLNPGFEDGTGSGATRDFNNTSNFFNRGNSNDQTQAARRESTDTGSSFVGQVNDRYNVITAISDFDSAAFGTVVHSQNTGHTISANEYFNLSYEWQDAFNWNDGLDEIRFVLFATDNNSLNGNIVWSSILDSGTSTLDSTYEDVLQSSSVVDGAAVGQTLFVNFFGFQNNGVLSASTGFARLDNVSIEAAFIPEPSAFASVLGLGVLGLAIVRGRRA